MAVIGIKTTRASELLKELTERGIIEPVAGHGKGKYRFKQ
jgi:ribosomal protein S25